MRTPDRMVPCYTGHDLGCVMAPYEHVARDLAKVVHAAGRDDHLVAAVMKVVGIHAQHLSETRTPTPTLEQFGEGLIATAEAVAVMDPVAAHEPVL